jgi:hypothetical protein
MAHRGRPRILAFLLAITLLAPIPLAAQHEQEWTVVTLARDGSWGVGTSEYYGPALASALRKGEAMSDSQSDCGAEVTAVRQGWTLGILCGDHRVLVAATELTTAIMDAQARQMVLRDLYGDGLPSCSCVMWVDPRGFAASSRKPWGAARTVLAK